MRQRQCSALLSCFVGLLCAISFLMCPDIKASAAVIYEQMSQSDTRALLGDSLPFNMTVDGVTTTQHFLYMSSYGGATLFNIETNPVFTNGNANFNYQNGRWIFYYSDTDQYGYIGKTVSIDMDLSIYATSGSLFYGGFGLSLNSSVYQNPTGADNVINGHNYINDSFSAPAFGDASANQDYYNTASMTFQLWNNNTIESGFRMFTYNDLSSVTSLHAEGKFYGVQRIFLAVYCPYVYGEISSSAPVTETTTTTSPSTTTDINVNVDVDLTETNGILSGIKQSIDNLVQAILNGLKALFIPSDDFMDGFKADMEELLSDHLGGLYEAEQIMVDSFEQLPNVAAKSEIYIPPAELPLGGDTFTVGGWHVPLKVSGLPAALYDGIAFIIDFLCIAAFLRMCRNKLEIFLNPDSEVIQQ